MTHEAARNAIIRRKHVLEGEVTQIDADIKNHEDAVTQDILVRRGKVREIEALVASLAHLEAEDS